MSGGHPPVKPKGPSGGYTAASGPDEAHRALSSYRSAAIEDILSDPPRVHEAPQGPPSGVWQTDLSCYEFLSAHARHGSSTLETGLGVSTALFAQWQTDHICVVGATDQIDLLKAWATARGVDLSTVRFLNGSSDQVLPSLSEVELDLVLIDGGHGFPIPTVDWYYSSLLLKKGGIVVIDDIHLPPVRDYLVAYLDLDPRWGQVARKSKWVAYEKLTGHSVREEWTEQGFAGKATQSLMNRVKIKLRALAPATVDRARSLRRGTARETVLNRTRPS